MRLPKLRIGPPNSIGHMRRYRQKRKSVFEWYWQIGLIVVFGFLCVYGTGVARGVVIPFAFWFVLEAIPGAIIAAWHDPLLIPACAIGSLFFWSFPYEGAWQLIKKLFLESKKRPEEPSNFRRGRPLSEPDTAGYRAYQALLRNRRRRRR